jgi:hypothetical protein
MEPNHLGTIKTKDGTNKSNPILTISIPTKGATSLNISTIGILVAILEITNTFNPTSGVIKPNSITTKDKIPNHILSSSVFSPNVELFALIS